MTPTDLMSTSHISQLVIYYQLTNQKYCGRYAAGFDSADAARVPISPLRTAESKS